MVLSVFLLILGFVFVVKGADWLVDGSASLARRYGIPELTIGLTIVALGTSTPEMVVNIIASIQGYNEVAMGNIVGSNNFNLFFILGLAGIVYPLTVQKTTVWKEIPMSLMAAAVVFILANDKILGSGESVLSRGDGFILYMFLIIFMVYIFHTAKHTLDEVQGNVKTQSLGLSIGLMVAGLAGLVIGGKLVVDQAVKIAQVLGMSERVIGLTIVAAGTSLPELATSVVAAFKRKSDIAIGNVVGSNILNIFFILATSAIIRPIPFNESFNNDLYFLLAGTFLLFITMFTGKMKKLDRWESVLLLLVYIGYTTWIIVKD